MEDIIYKEYKHNPPHLFIPNCKYFITGATYQRKPYLINDESKFALLSSIKKSFTDYKWQLEDWVILNNHYHIMVNSPEDPCSLSIIMKEIHRFNAMWIKKNIPQAKSEKIIWYNYWDSCITFETSYFARLNYLWFNPVKHGNVNYAEDWKHGSYYQRIEEEKDIIAAINDKYPFDKIKIDDDF